MEILGPLLALLVIVGIFYAVFTTVVYSHRNLKLYLNKDRVRLLSRLALVLIACVVGSLLASHVWRSSDTEMIMGFPIPVAAWEYRNGSWYDYVSEISLLFWVLDFIIGIGLVHLPIAGVLLVKKRKSIQLPEDAT